MPTSLTRRHALAALGSCGALAALPAHAETPKKRAIARLFEPVKDTISVALWGSSSMEGGLGAEHTPRPVYVHDEVRCAFDPVPVHNIAYGAQWSRHTTILRGLDTPLVTIPDGYTGGKVRVSVDAPIPALWSFRCHGTLSSGATGTLLGSPENEWYFESDAGPVTTGTFMSSWHAKCAQSRHVLWTGKNNIWDLETVKSDVDRLVEAARNPERDTIILGQWVTMHDLNAPDKLANMAALNEYHAEKYGDRFIDVQKILTSEEGLTSDPVRSLGLLDQADTRAELDQGIVPTPIRASDGVHLSGWGNLLVSWALIEKMKELAWM